MNCCWCGRVIDRVLYFTEFESLWPYLNGFHSKVRICRKLTASDQNKPKQDEMASWGGVTRVGKISPLWLYFKVFVDFIKLNNSKPTLAKFYNIDCWRFPRKSQEIIFSGKKRIFSLWRRRVELVLMLALSECQVVVLIKTTQSHKNLTTNFWHVSLSHHSYVLSFFLSLSLFPY